MSRTWRRRAGVRRCVFDAQNAKAGFYSFSLGSRKGGVTTPPLELLFF
ncbi:hypothetical protein PVAP13_2NG452003 [Panicum virgatum]|uniref:Uncharacterized protein n=1 Tax=Panicum virgatum TaxID=38727 RepID=A0A8T0VVJ7_PANVG|nr:hypothetical protein PVAP13_2NG452003 [Panicum virgatum]